MSGPALLTSGALGKEQTGTADTDYYQVKSAVITASATGATSVVAAQGAGKKIRVLAYCLRANAAVNWKWQSASTDKTGLSYNGGAGEGEAPSAPAGAWLFETAANEALNINLSGAVAVGGFVVYVVIGG